MAVTTSVVRRTVQGNRRVVFVDVTFDSSYTTGGLAFAPSTVGLTRFDQVIPTAALKSDKTLLCPLGYDYDNQKLIAFGTAGSATGVTEIANGTNLSTYTARVEAVGN